MQYEYTVIPAPTRADKVAGSKTPTDRFAAALSAELNRMAADGWDYVRADVLPSEERSGLTGRTTVYHNILVFRRALPEIVAEPEFIPAPVYEPEPVAEPEPVTPPLTDDPDKTH